MVTTMSLLTRSIRRARVVAAMLFLVVVASSQTHGQTPGQAQGAGNSSDGKPVKVFILSGQSNMVGAGKVDGGSSRWGTEFLDPVVSVYAGTYDPDTDYDSMQPVTTLKLDQFGGCLLYTSPSPRDGLLSRMPSSA